MGSNLVRIGGRTRMRRNARIMRKEPLCRPCRNKKPPRVTAAVEVDHIVPLSQGGTEDESNLQPICLDCHEEKTEKDLGLHTWPTVGQDGWPADRPHRSVTKKRRHGTSSHQEVRKTTTSPLEKRDETMSPLIQTREETRKTRRDEISGRNVNATKRADR